MALKTVVAISQKKLFVSAGSYEIDGVANVVAITYDLEAWLNRLILDAGGGTIDFKREFTSFLLPKSLKILDTSFANLLGLTVNQLYPAGGTFYSNIWGYTKLVLQNAENPSPLFNSMIQSFEEVPISFENNVVILRGFAPISDYEKSNDRESYNVEVRMFPVARRGDLKLFLEENAKGVSETVNMYGFAFKIAEDLNLNINLSPYSGIKDQHSNKNLKEFDIGFIVEV